MNLFPKAACAVTEIRQHPAFLYYSTSRLQGQEYSQLTLMKAFADLVDRNPGRYANGLSLEAFISDFPSHPVAMDALEILKKMRVYKVAEDVLLPLKVWKPKGHRTVTCISLPTSVLNSLKQAASEREISVSALITQLWSDQCKA
jgi:hypothetical protein